MKKLMFVFLAGCAHVLPPVSHGDIEFAEFKAASCCLVECRGWQNPDIVEVCETQCIAEVRSKEE